MAEPQHTAAPWVVRKDRLHGFDLSVVSPAGDAELGNWLVAGVRWQANADLIAAAPDLLAVLMEIERDYTLSSALNDRIAAAIQKANPEKST